MLVVKTKFGCFLPHNAVKIDIYKTKEDATWCCHLILDSYRGTLCSFESERDAIIFVREMRQSMIELITECGMDEQEVVDVSRLCQSAMKAVEGGSL